MSEGLTTFILIIVIFWVVPAFVSSILAGMKNRSPARWFFLTIIFGVIPLIIILFLPTVHEKTNQA